MLPQLQGIRPRNVLSRQRLRAGLREHASRTQLDDRDVQLIANGIDYKRARDIKRALQTAIMWLKRKVGAKPYALMVHTYDNRAGLKSSHWLAPKATRGIGRWPAIFVGNKYEEFQEAYDMGVRTFVVLEDASYSGSDLANSAVVFSDFVSASRATDAKLFMAVAYAAPAAKDTVAWVIRTNRLEKQVEFFAPRTMRMTQDFLNSLPKNRRERIAAFMFGQYPDSGEPFAIMAHKVPNGLSFPQAIGSAFYNDMVPLYKHVKFNAGKATAVRNHSARHVNSKTGRPLVVHRDGNKVLRYRDVGGRLERVRD